MQHRMEEAGERADGAELVLSRLRSSFRGGSVTQSSSVGAMPARSPSRGRVLGVSIVEE